MTFRRPWRGGRAWCAGRPHPTNNVSDFSSARALNKPIRDPELIREWSEGVSVFDSFGYAAFRAKRARYKLGRYIVELELPDDTQVEFRQTGGDRRHFTIYAKPETLIQFVVGEPISIRERDE